MREEKPESVLEGNAHRFALGGQAIAVLSLLFLVPFLRRRRAEPKGRHGRFAVLGH